MVRSRIFLSLVIYSNTMKSCYICKCIENLHHYPIYEYQFEFWEISHVWSRLEWTLNLWHDIKLLFRYNSFIKLLKIAMWSSVCPFQFFRAFFSWQEKNIDPYFSQLALSFPKLKHNQNTIKVNNNDKRNNKQ